MPVILERLPLNSKILLETFDNIKWLHDLVDLGKSSLSVVIRYWKQTLAYLLGRIKSFCGNKSVSAIKDIEKLISCGELFISLLICFPISLLPLNNLPAMFNILSFMHCRKSING